MSRSVKVIDLITDNEESTIDHRSSKRFAKQNVTKTSQQNDRTRKRNDAEEAAENNAQNLNRSN